MKPLFYLNILIFILGSIEAQHNVASQVGFVACFVGTIHHQVIVARGGVGRTDHVMMMDVGIAVVIEVVRLAESKRLC